MDPEAPTPIVVVIKRFEPKPDITLDELVTIYKSLPSQAGVAPGKVPVRFPQEVWDQTEPEIQRHFVDCD